MTRWSIVIKGSLFCLALLGITSCGPVQIGTVDWQPDGNGFIQFQTNDPANAEQGFVKLYPGANFDETHPLEVKVKKLFGTTGGGFGIVFCAANDQNYYKVLITIGKTYKVSYVSSGDDAIWIQDWTKSDALLTNLDSENTIRVEWNSSNSTFNLFFNGTLVENFADLAGGYPGQAGFYAYVSTVDDEYLPAGQVDVRFKMISPVAIP